MNELTTCDAHVRQTTGVDENCLEFMSQFRIDLLRFGQMTVSSAQYSIGKGAGAKDKRAHSLVESRD
jgi:hypothetical protein